LTGICGQSRRRVLAAFQPKAKPLRVLAPVPFRPETRSAWKRRGFALAPAFPTQKLASTRAAKTTTNNNIEAPPKLAKTLTIMNSRFSRSGATRQGEKTPRRRFAVRGVRVSQKRF
jgi:hypothetical protein